MTTNVVIYLKSTWRLGFKQTGKESRQSGDQNVANLASQILDFEWIPLDQQDANHSRASVASIIS